MKFQATLMVIAVSLASAGGCTDNRVVDALDSRVPAADIRVADLIAPDIKPPVPLWPIKAGGLEKDFGLDIALDTAGNVFVAGSFRDTARFGPGMLLKTRGKADVFLSKLDSNGRFLWTVTAGGSEDDFGVAVAVDAKGNCYITGCFEGKATFGPTVLSTGGNVQKVFVAKVSPKGDILWATRGGGQWGAAIGADAAGNSYVTGAFSGFAEFGSTTLTSKMYGGTMGGFMYDIYVVKLDTNGKYRWARSMGGERNDFGYSIAADQSGNTWATGYFVDEASFGSLTLVNKGDPDLYVARYDPAGKLRWVTTAGSAMGWAIGKDVTVDGAGNSYVAGDFKGVVTFGSSTLSSGGGWDIFAAKLDDKGKPAWVTSGGGYDDVQANALAVDGKGRLTIAGSAKGTATMGNSVVISRGDSDIFVARLDAAGKFTRALGRGDKLEDSAVGVALDSAGNSYVAGSFQGTVAFYPTSLTAVGKSDIFVWKPVLLGP